MEDPTKKGDDGQGGGDQPNAGNENIDLKALNETIKGLQNKVDVLEERNLLLESERQKFSDELIELKKPKPDAGVKEETDDDLNLLTPAQLYKKLHKDLKDAVVGVMKEVKSTVEQSSTNAAVEKARRELEEAKAKYPDFMEHKKDIYEIAKAHPTLSPEEAYLMVKARKERIEKEKSEKLAKQKELERKTLTEKASRVPQEVAGKEKMSPVEAFEDAWSKTMQDEE